VLRDPFSVTAERDLPALGGLPAAQAQRVNELLAREAK